MKGEVRIGQDRSRQVITGWDRSGQVRTGKVRAYQGVFPEESQETEK